MTKSVTAAKPHASQLAAIPPGRRITLEPVLRDLVSDGLVSTEDAERLLADLPVIDLTVEDPPIEDVIERVFAGGAA